MNCLFSCSVGTTTTINIVDTTMHVIVCDIRMCVLRRIHCCLFPFNVRLHVAPSIVARNAYNLTIALHTIGYVRTIGSRIDEAAPCSSSLSTHCTPNVNARQRN